MLKILDQSYKNFVQNEVSKQGSHQGFSTGGGAFFQKFSARGQAVARRQKFFARRQVLARRQKFSARGQAMTQSQKLFSLNGKCTSHVEQQWIKLNHCFENINKNVVLKLRKYCMIKI